VEGERTRLAHEGHVVQFAEEAVSLAVIAIVAAGAEVLPGGSAAARAGKNVVEDGMETIKRPE